MNVKTKKTPIPYISKDRKISYIKTNCIYQICPFTYKQFLNSRKDFWKHIKVNKYNPDKIEWNKTTGGEIEDHNNKEKVYHIEDLEYIWTEHFIKHCNGWLSTKDERKKQIESIIGIIDKETYELFWKVYKKEIDIHEAIYLSKNKNVEHNIAMKAISLFSGMGGDSLGIQNAGLELVAYSEWEKEMKETHEKNFKNTKLIGCGDITNTSDDEFLEYKDEVNLIFAGFPCQGFSHAGKKLPDDPRNTLFREFLRSTRLIRPKYIIGENVKGLLSRKTVNGVLYIDVIKDEFNKIDYEIYHKVYMCSKLDIGVPQNRERLVIVGIRKDLKQTFTFPKENNEKCGDLKKIVSFNMKGALKIEPEYLDFDFDDIPEECIMKDMKNEEEENNPHPNLVQLAKKRDYVRNEVSRPHRLHFGRRLDVGGEIIDIRKPINTIICSYAHCPRFFVPLKNKNGNYLRCLLPTELKQIQGFPKDYIISGNTGKQIKQIGNAVPPPLIEMIVRELLQVKTKA